MAKTVNVRGLSSDVSRRALIVATIIPLVGCANARFVSTGNNTASEGSAFPTRASDVAPGYEARFSTGDEAYVYRGGWPFHTEFIGRAQIETASNYLGRDRFSVGGPGAPASGAPVKERSEYACDEHVRYGADIWISFQVSLSDFIPDTWFLFAQFHDVPDKGEPATIPPLAFELVENSLGMRVVTRSSPLRLRRSSADYQERVIYQVAQFERNRWHRFVLRARFGQEGDGSVSLWHDGSLAFNGPAPIGFNDAISPYFKYGAYRGATSGLAVVEFATMELSWGSLESRVASPLSIRPVSSGTVEGRRGGV